MEFEQWAYLFLSIVFAAYALAIFLKHFALKNEHGPQHPHVIACHYLQWASVLAAISFSLSVFWRDLPFVLGVTISNLCLTGLFALTIIGLRKSFEIRDRKLILLFIACITLAVNIAIPEPQSLIRSGIQQFIWSALVGYAGFLILSFIEDFSQVRQLIAGATLSVGALSQAIVGVMMMFPPQATDERDWYNIIVTTNLMIAPLVITLGYFFLVVHIMKPAPIQGKAFKKANPF